MPGDHALAARSRSVRAAVSDPEVGEVLDRGGRARVALEVAGPVSKRCDAGRTL